MIFDVPRVSRQYVEAPVAAGADASARDAIVDAARVPRELHERHDALRGDIQAAADKYPLFYPPLHNGIKQPRGIHGCREIPATFYRPS